MPVFSKMQRVLMALGVAAVVSAMPLAHAQAAASAFQYVTSTSMHLPAIMSMFMHNKPGSSTTTTIGPMRTRLDESDGTSTIIACDLQKMIFLDSKNKTYYETSFDDLTKNMATAISAAVAKAKTSTSPPPAVNGTGEMTVSFDEKPDDQTQVIAGITAHHAVDTITYSMSGTGDCAKMASSNSMSYDIWYAPIPYKMSCPVHMKPVAMPQQPTSSAPCMQNFQVQANSRASKGRLLLKSTMTMGPKAMGISTTSEVTSAQTIPYDQSFFDAPAAYTKVDAPAIPHS
jgi:hypothetical protein